MSNLGQLLADVQARLSQVSDTAYLDAQVLLAHILDRSRSWVLAHPEVRLSLEQHARLDSALARLMAGEPLPYTIGRWEFYGLEFELSPDTLIPRPETELLVERALAWLESRPQRCVALDIGCGSGCIAIALAVNMPCLRVLGLDISLGALQVARSNARNHAVAGRVQFIQADLFPPIKFKIDLLCANLPYIPTGELRSLAVSRREPWRALDGGPDGLDFIRRTLTFAPRILGSGALGVLEIGETQGPLAKQLGRIAFPEANVSVIPDLAGRDRILVIQT